VDFLIPPPPNPMEQSYLLPDDLCKLATFGKVYELVGVMEKVRVALLQEEDVCLVLAEKGDAGGVDGPQLLQIELEVVRH
jgi:hypothetical protein